MLSSNGWPASRGPGPVRATCLPNPRAGSNRRSRSRQRAGATSVTANRLLRAWPAPAGTGAAKAIAAARVNAQSLNRAIEEVRKGRKADSATAEEGYDALHTEAEAER